MMEQDEKTDAVPAATPVMNPSKQVSEKKKRTGTHGGNRFPTKQGVDDEWKSIKGRTRCEHIFGDDRGTKGGSRCRKWSERGTTRCVKHAGLERRPIPKGYQFQTAAMQKIYDRFKYDPDRVDISGELAIVRTCLQGVLNKINGIEDPSQIPLEYMTFIISASKDAADLAERLNRIERGLQLTLNVGQFQQIIQVISTELINYLPPEQLDELLEKFQNLPWPQGKILKDCDEPEPESEPESDPEPEPASDLPNSNSDADCVGSISEEPAEGTE